MGRLRSRRRGALRGSNALNRARAAVSYAGEQVEDILDMRTKADASFFVFELLAELTLLQGTGSLECLVKWKGYEHFADTWEPASMLEVRL